LNSFKISVGNDAGTASPQAIKRVRAIIAAVLISFTMSGRQAFALERVIDANENVGDSAPLFVTSAPQAQTKK
jgi:hypothetical protein